MNREDLVDLIDRLGIEVVRKINRFGISNVTMSRYHDGRIDFYSPRTNVLVYRHEPAYAVSRK